VVFDHRSAAQAAKTAGREITNVKDDRLTVKIADGVKVEVARSFVANKVQDPS